MRNWTGVAPTTTITICLEVRNPCPNAEAEHPEPDLKDDRSFVNCVVVFALLSGVDHSCQRSLASLALKPHSPDMDGDTMLNLSFGSSIMRH